MIGYRFILISWFSLNAPLDACASFTGKPRDKETKHNFINLAARSLFYSATFLKITQQKASKCSAVQSMVQWYYIIFG